MAPVVQKLDNAIHWIAQLVSVTLNRWIVIYPVDSAIQCLNNWSLAIYLINFLRIFYSFQSQWWPNSKMDKKSKVPVQNHWVQKTMSPKLKILGPLCDQTGKRHSFVKHNEEYKKYASLNNSHRNHTKEWKGMRHQYIGELDHLQSSGWNCGTLRRCSFFGS